MSAGAGLGGAGLFPAGLGGGAPTASEPYVPGDPPAVVQGDELAQQTGHVAQALALLIEQFKRKANIQDLLRPWVNEVQAAEDAAFQVLEDRWLDTAIGAQLDTLGNIVAEERLGRDDETYRVALRARVAINRSHGTVEELLNILRLLLPEGTAIRIDEQYPAAIVVEIEDAIDEDLGSQVAQLVCSARAAGVKCLVHWFRAGDVFRYGAAGSEAASPNGFGSGDYSATSDGTVVHTFVA